MTTFRIRSSRGIMVDQIIFGKPVSIALDPRKILPGRISVTSHGHTDHTPSSIRHPTIIASDTTRKMISFYKPKTKIENTTSYKADHVTITLHDAGHCLGSRMTMITNNEIGEKTLYTGDYNTVKKYCGQGKAKRADKLIIDSTYGKEKYAFPEYTKTVEELRAHLESQKTKVAIRTYSFGKPQEICHLLNTFRMPFSVDDRIASINKAIGAAYKHEQEDADIMVTRKHIPTHHNIGLSGWASQSSYRYMAKVDEAFVMSDHADYPSGMKFISKADPETVYPVFGYAKEFAEKIQKETGVKALPLITGQHSLQSFIEP
ncbi:MAG: hypothetical protein ACOC32_00315 [Nanoarchaeota archaeon]